MKIYLDIEIINFRIEKVENGEFEGIILILLGRLSKFWAKIFSSEKTFELSLKFLTTLAG